MIAEAIDGELSLLPRPRGRHLRAAGELHGELRGPFDHGRDGPGGWVCLDEPELRLGPRPDITLPDFAGWRRERLGEGLLDESDALTLAPDWCCEVLSPSTEKLDRGRTMDVYHRDGVGHLWLLSPTLRTLEVYRRADPGCLRVATCEGDAAVRAEPFDALELDLAGLWTRWGRRSYHRLAADRGRANASHNLGPLDPEFGRRAASAPVFPRSRTS